MHVVEWSYHQNCFNLITLEQMLKNNREALIGNYETQYIPVFISESEHEASTMCKLMIAERDARERFRS